MNRDLTRVSRYWDKWIEFGFTAIAEMRTQLIQPSGDPSYRPQFVFEIAKEHWHLMLRRYSRGDAIADLPVHFSGMLDAWEESVRLGLGVHSSNQQYTRQSWAVNYDHYVICFWLVGLALALDIPDSQWHRLLALVGNEGEDILLDRVIATRTPSRRVGAELCFKTPYSKLLAAIDAPPVQRARLLRVFVDHWYQDMGAIGKSGRAKQVVPYPYPYWYKLGDQDFEGGAYFGRWCVEAVAAVKAFGLDDNLCLGHPNYPGDLLRANGPSTHELQLKGGTGWLSRLFKSP